MNRKKLLLVFLLSAAAGSAAMNSHAAELRRSPVSYHMSFENRDFLKDDFIEHSGKISAEDRHIDFPEGKFGRGIRMNFIPEKITIETANGRDLDPVTAIVYNYRTLARRGRKPGVLYEPVIWGSGKINARLGGVVFWAKGKPPYSCRLFQLSSAAFGRKERDLIAVSIDENSIISAYLRDARYVRHELKTDVLWNPEDWNHVVFNWDWANGLELWLNGEKIASSWGEDGWFETPFPGPFQLSAPGFIYDEVYLMDRPLNRSEIKRLMSSNRAPGNESPFYDRKKHDEGRIAQYSGSDSSGSLPVVTPDSGICFTEVYPSEAADGHVQGWYIIDGRNEMAWPHEYSFFTTTPGDADFHAEKVDIKIPPEAQVNFIALTGNLTGVKVQAGSPGKNDFGDIFNVPGGERFFYGSTITATEGAVFRIPFTSGYGCPSDFQSEVVRLPQSGEKRIHNVGLYHVAPSAKDIEGQRYTINLNDGVPDNRYSFAVHALTSRDERRIALASSEKISGKKGTVDIGAFRRLNILSEPFTEPVGITSVALSLPVKTVKSEETLYIRVHDPAVPSRTWNRLAVNLKGFDKKFRTLKLTIDFHDLVLTGGDRLWLDLGSTGGCRLSIGDSENPSELITATVPSYIAVDAYAEKEIISAKAQYSKMYEFMPWKLTGKTATLEKPYSFGGAFDMILPALAVRRVKPDHFAARYMELMCGPRSQQIPVDGGQADPALISLKTITDPYGAPDWAVYIHEYLTYGNKIIDWWKERQNPDGQLGGGWNDDTLFIGHHQPYLPLDGNENARAIIDTVHTKIEAKEVFRDGYCRLSPMDRLHVGDFVSERYTTVLNNLGQAYAAEREMETAWHHGHPERTPKNYGDGRAFKSSFNVLNWYWGKDVPKEPYKSKPLDEVKKDLRLFASVWTDFALYRYTESGVHRDDYSPYGTHTVYRFLLGGSKGARTDAHPNMAVMWPSGGGPDMARVMLRSDDTSLDALCYSFDSVKRDLKMRLCRIHDGRYRIGLYSDPQGTGNAGEPVWEIEKDLMRFDVVTLPVPPRTPLIIRVEQLESHDRPAELPDLVIDPWDANRNGSTVKAVVHNLGNSAAVNVAVRLLNGEETLQEKTIARIDAPTDFVAKRTTVTFENVPASRNLKVIVDPDSAIQEILEENNAASVR